MCLPAAARCEFEPRPLHEVIRQGRRRKARAATEFFPLEKRPVPIGQEIGREGLPPWGSGAPRRSSRNPCYAACNAESGRGSQAALVLDSDNGASTERSAHGAAAVSGAPNSQTSKASA